MGDFATDYLRGYELGQRLRMERERLEAELQDREQRRKLTEYNLKRDKIADQLKAQEIQRQLSMDAYKMMQGQPGAPASMPAETSMQVPPQSAPAGAPQGIADIITRAKQAGVGGMEVQGATSTGELRHAPMTIPGFNVPGEETPYGPLVGMNVPEVTARPETREELQNATMQDLLLKARMEAAKTAMTEAAKQPYALERIMAGEGRQPNVGYTPEALEQQLQLVKARGEASGAAGQRELIKSQAVDIAEEIMAGRQPPDLQGLARQGLAGAIKDEFAKKDFNLTEAMLDYKAMQKYMATLNGDRQMRMRQAINFATEHLPLIEDLYSQWQRTKLPSGYQSYNRGALWAAKNLPGESGAIASSLIAQLNDFTSEMGTVYKGGNSSTDETLRLASENLKGEWNSETFRKQVGILKKTLQIRANSINLGPVGMSGNMPYGQGRGYTESTSSPEYPAPKVGDTKTFPNGAIGQWDGKGWVKQ